MRSYSQSLVWRCDLDMAICQVLRSDLVGVIGIAYAVDLFAVERFYPQMELHLRIDQQQPIVLSMGKNFFEASISPTRSLVALVGGPLALLVNYKTAENFVLPMQKNWNFDLVVFSESGNYLATISHGRSLIVWDVTNLSSPVLIINRTLPKEITGITFGMMDTYLFFGHKQGVVSCLKFDTRRYDVLFSTGSKASIGALLWHTTKEVLITSDWTGITSQIDVKKGGID